MFGFDPRKARSKPCDVLAFDGEDPIILVPSLMGELECQTASQNAGKAGAAYASGRLIRIRIASRKSWGDY